MKPRTKRLLVISSLAVLAGLSLCWLEYYFLSPDSPLNRASAIKCALEWGRLAPFPTSAQQLTITTQGGIFTRSFRLSFIALPADIERWLEKSPGTSATKSTSASPQGRHFDIVPDGGAVVAEVDVDDNQHRVLIFVCWS